MIQRHRTLYQSERIYNSGDKPILVTCADFQKWVCKHGRLSPSVLVNEVIGSKFADCWELKTPPICFIEVAEEHVPDSPQNLIQPAYFKKPCFGSLLIKDSLVIDNTVLPSFKKASYRRKIKNKTDLLKIALFDIWLANDDRHHGNSNSLVDMTEHAHFYFSVFDHGALFNTNNLKYGINLISYNESLIYSDLYKIMFGRINNLSQIVDNIVAEFYLCIAKCEDELSDLLEDIPKEWNIDLDTFEKLIRDNLFNAEWYTSCVNHFRTLIQEHI